MHLELNYTLVAIISHWLIDQGQTHVIMMYYTIHHY